MPESESTQDGQHPAPRATGRRVGCAPAWTSGGRIIAPIGPARPGPWTAFRVPQTPRSRSRSSPPRPPGGGGAAPAAAPHLLSCYDMETRGPPPRAAGGGGPNAPAAHRQPSPGAGARPGRLGGLPAPAGVAGPSARRPAWWRTATPGPPRAGAPTRRRSAPPPPRTRSPAWRAPRPRLPAGTTHTAGASHHPCTARARREGGGVLRSSAARGGLGTRGPEGATAPPAGLSRAAGVVPLPRRWSCSPRGRRPRLPPSAPSISAPVSGGGGYPARGAVLQGAVLPRRAGATTHHTPGSPDRALWIIRINRSVRIATGPSTVQGGGQGARGGPLQGHRPPRLPGAPHGARAGPTSRLSSAPGSPSASTPTRRTPGPGGVEYMAER